VREGYKRHEVLPSGFLLEFIEQHNTRLTYVLQPDAGSSDFIQRVLSLIRCIAERRIIALLTIVQHISVTADEVG
jgi:hypothetical protein